LDLAGFSSGSLNQLIGLGRKAALISDHPGGRDSNQDSNQDNDHKSSETTTNLAAPVTTDCDGRRSTAISRSK